MKERNKIIVIVFGLIIVVALLFSSIKEETSVKEVKGCSINYIGYFNEDGYFVDDTHSFPLNAIEVIFEAKCSETTTLKEKREWAKKRNITMDRYGNINYNVTWTNNTLFIGDVYKIASGGK